MGANAIEVVGLSKRYFLGEDHPGASNLRETIAARVKRAGRARPPRPEIWSLRDVTFDVAAGSAVGIIGRNGAGKSTLLKVISRITEPTAGMSRTRGRVGSLLEVGTGFHPELTGRENVYLNGAILGMSRRTTDRVFDEIVDFAGVERFLDTPVKRYSSGMYLRLAFAVAAHLDSEILLVDEVLAVGDAEFQRKCLGRMSTVGRAGRTVLFVSHNLDAIVRLCPECIWLDQGVVMETGPSAEVVDRYLTAGVERIDRVTFPDTPELPANVAWVSVLNAGGEATSVLRRDEPFVVEVGVRSRAPIEGLNLAVSVRSRRGVLLLDESTTDDPSVRLAKDAGLDVARVTIPPVLNSGDYVVGVWLGTDFEEMSWIEEALLVHLEGVPGGRPDRALQLRLPWDVTRGERPG
jgi:ABC-2 type transport system ATP-binding protein/lipopolysaccharide transport system ATP-binding protein